MRYSDELIERIRDNNNIVDVIGEYVRLKKNGRRYIGLCPFHSEKTPSFSVSEDKQLYYCFGCHEAGNVFTFIQKYQNSTFSEALQILADRAHIELPKAEKTEQQKAYEDRREKQFAIMKQAAAFFHYKLKCKDSSEANAYLKKRKLSDETIKAFGLGYSSVNSRELYRYLKSRNFTDSDLKDSGLFTYNEKYGVSDKFWNRIMFPICDERGKVIGFGGRVMGDAKPKYLNSPETEIFNKRRQLFALNIARHASGENIILCEGYMDVISMHQAGFRNAVASLGTALTPEQAVKLKKYTKEVLIMYDSDGAGTSAALRAIPILSEAGLATKVVKLTPSKDPDEFIKSFGAEELEKRIKNAQNGFLFIIDNLAASYDLNDPQEKTRFENEAAGLLLRFEDELERMNYLESICTRYGLPGDLMARRVASLAMRGVHQVTYERPKSSNFSVKAEDAGTLSQKMMIYYLSNYKDAYEAVKDLVGPDDFTDPFYRKLAELLFDQIKEGKINAAGIVDEFDDLEEQRKAAEAFNENLGIEKKEQLERAFTDTVIKFLNESINSKMSSDNSGAEYLSRLMEIKILTENYKLQGKVFTLTDA
ncbi:MAG: DNA primase [Lachnospiraceae bacterium]|jgi:DNA primase